MFAVSSDSSCSFGDVRNIFIRLWTLSSAVSHCSLLHLLSYMLYAMTFSRKPTPLIHHFYTNAVIHSPMGVRVWTLSLQLPSPPSPSSFLSSLWPEGGSCMNACGPTFCCCYDVARERFLFLTRYSIYILYISELDMLLLLVILSMLPQAVVYKNCWFEMIFTARRHASTLCFFCNHIIDSWYLLPSDVVLVNLYILLSISNFVLQCCSMLVMLVEARIVNFCTQASYQVYQKTHVLFVRQTGSSLPILEVHRFWFWQFSGSGDHFSTDHHQMSCTNKIQQYRLCIQWRMKPEI